MRKTNEIGRLLLKNTTSALIRRVCFEGIAVSGVDYVHGFITFYHSQTLMSGVSTYTLLDFVVYGTRGRDAIFLSKSSHRIVILPCVSRKYLNMSFSF